MKSYSELPYTTDNHEFHISWDRNNAYIKILCKNEHEAFNNPILLEEFREMIITASTKEVKEVVIDTMYSIEVHSKQWKETESYHNIKISKHIKD
jgi:hypothetical protein